MKRHAGYQSVVLLHVIFIAIGGTVIQANGNIGDRYETNGAEYLIRDNYPIRSLGSGMHGYDRNPQAPLIDDLRGLYRVLMNHPALMEGRLRVGSRLPPALPENMFDITHSLKKRSIFDVGLAVPVCSFTTEWKLLYRAKDANNTMVEIFQPNDNSNRYQWFYTVSCDYVSRLLEPGQTCRHCCRGIDEHRYSSRCLPRKSFVMALIRQPGSADYYWDYIQVDTSCGCAVLLR